MENNEQSSQAPVVEDNGGPVRGHSEALPPFQARVSPCSQDLESEITQAEFEAGEFETALGIVKRRMMEAASNLKAGAKSKHAMAFVHLFCVGENLSWNLTCEDVSVMHAPSLDVALESIGTPESRAAKKAETLRAEIAAKQSELERLEGRVN